jgi:hypothetical protein
MIAGTEITLSALISGRATAFLQYVAISSHFRSCLLWVDRIEKRSVERKNDVHIFCVSGRPTPVNVPNRRASLHEDT